jgi:enoyl-CoA hydratase/carnithine racemase
MAEFAPPLLEERHGDVLLLTLNRPEKHNALNAALTHMLGDAVRRAAPAGVHVIVVTGAGDRAFCAGGDMLEMSGVEATSVNLPPPGERLNGFAEISATPLPVIAAINGICYGGGARLAVGCDIRLASDDATFRLPGAEYGLVVAAAHLPRLVGSSRAKEWIFTARKFGAKEALDAGLVSSLHRRGDLLGAAMEMAHLIAGHDQDAVRESKRVIDAASLDQDAVHLEGEINRGLRGTGNQTARFREATRKVTGR